MALNPNRDYGEEYRVSRSTPARIQANRNRKSARRLMIKKHGAAALKGKEVDHKNMNPLNNSASNLKIASFKANRAKQPKRS